MDDKSSPNNYYERAWSLIKQNATTFGIPFIIYQLYSMLKSPGESLRDKVVLITGASSGIGEAIAHKFHSQGCKVILAARRVEELNRVKNDLLKKTIENFTHEPMVMYMDLNDLETFPDCVNKILDTYGQIDVLVNNAGIGFRGSVVNTVMEVDKKIMNINYFAQVALTKAVLPHMIKRKSGHIVYMNSIQAKIGLPRRSAYAASKHALEGFCDSLRAEVQRFNIKISNMCPSWVTTPLFSSALTETGEINKENEVIEGLSPENVAEEVFNAVVSKKNEVLLGPILHRLFVRWRNIFLPFYFQRLITFENKYVQKEKKEQQ